MHVAEQTPFMQVAVLLSEAGQATSGEKLVQAPFWTQVSRPPPGPQRTAPTVHWLVQLDEQSPAPEHTISAPQGMPPPHFQHAPSGTHCSTWPAELHRLEPSEHEPLGHLHEPAPEHVCGAGQAVGGAHPVQPLGCITQS